MIRNSVKLIGRIGNRLDVKVFDGKRKMARISLVTSESRKNIQGEWITDTQWHNLVAWGKQAEYVELNTVKGTEVSIEGRLISRSYTDKDGLKKYITEVVINQVSLIEKETEVA